MIPGCEFQHLPLSSIDADDRTYCLIPWEERPGADLLASIRRFGVLHPPILCRREDKSYLILAGRKRILALHRLAPDAAVLCGIVADDMKASGILALLLEESVLGKPLSPAEQVFFLEKAVQHMGPDEVLPFLEKMGHKPRKHILDGLLELPALGDTTLRAIHAGAIHLKTAGKLLGFPATDREFLVRLLADLQFGGSKQQKLVDLCTELTRRRNIPLENILADSPLTGKKGQEDNIPQQGSALLAWLHDECFPRTVSAEKQFRRQVTDLHLPPMMHITHTPSFEDDAITLSLRFPDWQALFRVVEDLKKIIPAQQTGPS